jgi:hypothetical protein
MQGSMNVRGSGGVPVKGTVYGVPPGRHAQLDASNVEGVGDMNDRAPESKRPDLPDRTAEPPDPGSRAFAEAKTDSWILPADPNKGPEPATARPQPRPWHESAQAPPRSASPAQDGPRAPAYGGAGQPLEPSRRGPVVLDADDWDGDPGKSRASDNAGGRRGGASLRTWLGVAAAIVVLAGAVGLPFLRHSSSPANPSGAAAGVGGPDSSTNGDLPAAAPSATGPTGELGNPASGAPAPSGSVVNSADALQILASALAAQGQGQNPGQNPAQNPALPGIPLPTTATQPGQPPAPPAAAPTTASVPAALPPPPPAAPAKFPTTTIQATSGTRTNGAGVLPAMCAGSPQVVGPLGSVTMTVPGSIPTSGTYNVQVFFTDPFFEIASGSISANGGPSQSFTVLGPTNCPASAGTFNLTLHAGTGNKITIGRTSFGLALNIARIVVSQP